MDLSKPTKNAAITKEQFLLDEGLDFNILFVLQNPNAKIKNSRFDGWKRLAVLKDCITEDGELTEKGIIVTDLFKPVAIPIAEQKEAEPLPPFSKWVVDLHAKLEQVLVDGIGKKQKVIDKKYSFLCNAKDLESKLKVMISKYKIKDLKKCEKVLERYVRNCIESNFEYTQLVQYYLMKDNVSKFYTDFENWEDIKTEEEYYGTNL